jgi:hypothetical protein
MVLIVIVGDECGHGDGDGDKTRTVLVKHGGKKDLCSCLD